MSHYHHFTIQERESILLMLEQGKSLGSIAKALERSPSSVSRELKRNGMPSSMYSPEQAQKKCESRVERKQLKKQHNRNSFMFQTKHIKLYGAVCDNSSLIKRETQRQSNNFRPQFTDEACITVDLWGISQRRFKRKDIDNYIKNYLLEWFPKLPSCQAFSRRGNALASAMRALSEVWMNTAKAFIRMFGRFLPNYAGAPQPCLSCESSFRLLCS